MRKTRAVNPLRSQQTRQEGRCASWPQGLKPLKIFWGSNVTDPVQSFALLKHNCNNFLIDKSLIKCETTVNVVSNPVTARYRYNFEHVTKGLRICPPHKRRKRKTLGGCPIQIHCLRRLCPTLGQCSAWLWLIFANLSCLGVEAAAPQPSYPLRSHSIRPRV